MKKILETLPEDWKEYPLRDVAPFLRRGKSPVYSEEYQGLSVINQDCIRWEEIDLDKVKSHQVPHNLSEEFFLKRDDILINSTGTGTIGRINQWCYEDVEAVADSHVTVLRIDNKTVNSTYTRYFLSSEAGQRYLESVCYTGSTNQIELSRRYLSRFRLPAPDYPVQESIAGVLSKVDEAIKIVEESIKAAERLKKSLIQKFLTGKLKPDGTRRTEKELVLTKYGFAPSEWKYCQIKDLIRDKYILNIQDGNHGEKHPKSDDFTKEGIPFVMASDISSGKVDYDACSKIPRKIADALRIGFAKNGDVLLSHKASIGYTCIVENADPYIMLTPQVTYYRCDSTKLRPEYLLYFFQTYNFQNIVEGLAKQSTRNYIGITNQKKLWIYIPESTEEQLAVVKPLIEIDKSIDAKKEKIKTIKCLKKSLMQHLLTGKVRLDVEKINNLLKEAS